MIRRNFFAGMMIFCGLLLVAGDGWAQGKEGLSGKAGELPAVTKTAEGAWRLIVDGKTFIVLGA